MKLQRAIWLQMVGGLVAGLVSGWAAIADAEAVDPFQQAEVRKVVLLHDACIAGSIKEVLVAEASLQEWIGRDPTDALAQVYMGSLLTIKSSKTGIGPQKLRLLKEGVRMMDAAVDLAPERAEVRFVRGVNSFQLPAFCGRRDTARADFRWLVDQLRNPGSRAAALSAETRQAMYYYAGLVFRQAHDVAQARAVWEAGLPLVPATGIALKIQEQLRKLGSD